MKEPKKYEIVDENWIPTQEAVEAIRRQLSKINDYNYDYDGSESEIGGGWIYECVERFGGGEGDGETHWIVFSLSKGDVKKHFRINGYYQSYDGAYLDGDIEEVEEKEKVVKVWGKV